jgi:AhpC/TSA family
MKVPMTSAVLCGLAFATAISTGPSVGQKVPDFRLEDQNGSPRTLRSILGPKGALLVFYRSADW